MALDGIRSLLEHWTPLDSLWEIFAHEEFRPAGLEERPPVLILDQFEEVFTLGGKRPVLAPNAGDATKWRALHPARRPDGKPPTRGDSAPLSSRSTAGARLRVRPEQRARVVWLALREDYLAQLEEWKATLPSLMRNRMPLRLLTGPQALEAVVRPGRMEGRNSW